MGRRVKMSDLQKLAAKRKDREALRAAVAVVHGRKMTRRQVRRAKFRQDRYIFLKSLMVTVETISVLFISFMGIITFFELRNDTESSFYATQLSIELVLLLIVISVVNFESTSIRVLAILAFIIVLLLNVVQIFYFMLFDKHSPICSNIRLLFGCTQPFWAVAGLQPSCHHRPGKFNSSGVLCISPIIPLHHHSSFAAALLTLLHAILVVIAIAVATAHQGSISEIVQNTDPSSIAHLMSRRQRHHVRSRKGSRRRRRAHHRTADSGALRSRQPQRPDRSAATVTSQNYSRSIVQETKAPRSPKLSRYAKLDITKLPDGTRFKTADKKGFQMEYYVEDGVFVGSGTENLSKSISICAPVRRQYPLEESENSSTQ
ncbi:hypothetical protein Y032_0024g948 [Ancylostoma ceylanicum]|uniref:Uncharacterized protein n=1 Tax=Ancylostoma ceylanicum TaxID=53326 RepID=A0A016UXV9_9BILA|nr:hypothetical protein Y032_0024g948 [Ancylostoma ceylanicum]